MKFEVRWSQSDGGCGETECSKTFDDREDAFAFSYGLETGNCKGIRVYTLALALTPHGKHQAPAKPHKPHATKATKRYVVMGLSAESDKTGRQAYKVMLVGEPGESRLLVSGRRDYTVLGQFVVTESTAKRSYSAAWKAYQTHQEALEARTKAALDRWLATATEATPEAPQTQTEPIIETQAATTIQVHFTDYWQTHDRNKYDYIQPDGGHVPDEPINTGTCNRCRKSYAACKCPDNRLK